MASVTDAFDGSSPAGSSGPPPLATEIPEPMQAILVVEQGAEAGRVFALGARPLTVGRSVRADIRLADKGVSLEHARIFRQGGYYRIEDLGSKNGTRVGGEAVDEAELHVGDSLILGTVVLRFTQRPADTMTVLPPRDEDSASTTGRVPPASVFAAARADQTPFAPTFQSPPHPAPPPGAYGTPPPPLGQGLSPYPSAPPPQHRTPYGAPMPPPGYFGGAPQGYFGGPPQGYFGGPPPGYPPLMPVAPPRDDDDDEGSMNLADIVDKILLILGFFRRHVLLIGVLATLGALGGASIHFLSPPPSVATFEIRLIPEVTDNPVDSFQRANVNFFQSAEPNFTSINAIAATLVKLGHETPNEDEVLSIQSRLALSATITPNTYSGKYTSSTPEDALSFLDMHVRTYLDSEIEKTLRVIRKEVEFLSDQLTDHEKELRRTESELLRFKQEHIDGLPDQARNHYDQLVRLRLEEGTIGTQIERIQLELSHSQQKLGSETPLVESRVLATRPYQAQLVTIQRSIVDAKSKGLGEDHPDVKALRAQAAELKALSESIVRDGDTEVERSANPVYETYRDKVNELQVSEKVARKELERVRENLQNVRQVVDQLPELEARYAELTRSYDLTKGFHDRIFQQLNTSQLQLELERAQAAGRYDIISPPHLEVSSPTKKIILKTIMFALLGFMLGSGIAGFGELKQHVARLRSERVPAGAPPSGNKALSPPQA